MNKDFRVIEANKYFIDMFGYESSEIIGENIKTIVPEDRTEETDNYIHKLAAGENINSKTVRK